MDRIPVLNVEEIESLAEYTCLMVLLDSESLFGVQSTEALVQPSQNFLLYYQYRFRHSLRTRALKPSTYI
jgi:hypothetical protein